MPSASRMTNFCESAYLFINWLSLRWVDPDNTLRKFNDENITRIIEFKKMASAMDAKKGGDTMKYQVASYGVNVAAILIA